MFFTYNQDDVSLEMLTDLLQRQAEAYFMAVFGPGV